MTASRLAQGVGVEIYGRGHVSPALLIFDAISVRNGWLIRRTTWRLTWLFLLRLHHFTCLSQVFCAFKWVCCYKRQPMSWVMVGMEYILSGRRLLDNVFLELIPYSVFFVHSGFAFLCLDLSLCLRCGFPFASEGEATDSCLSTIAPVNFRSRLPLPNPQVNSLHQAHMFPASIDRRTPL